jgi:ParB family chromosome partitioning protein
MQTVTDDDGKKLNKHGLGRGLDSLIPISIDETGEEIKVNATDFISVGLIDPNPHQPRQNFEEVSLSELAGSIREHGILQPLLLTPNENRYQLIAGERRLRAAKIAGLKEVPVIIRTLDEQSKLELALIENVQRENLNPIEAAYSYKKLMDEFNLTQDEVARKVGKARSTIANTVRLLSLPVEIKAALSKGVITEGHARTLLGIENKDEQLLLFQNMVSGKITVRQAESRSSRVKNSAAGKTKDPNFEAAEKKLEETLGSKVVIKSKSKGGQIVIGYYSLEDLERIYKIITNS